MAAVVSTAVPGLGAGVASAQSVQADVKPLVERSCLGCHGERTVTPLNLARLGFDLSDRETFRAWERVVDRVDRGEMPPAGSPRPDQAVARTAIGSLKRALVEANLAARGGQRSPLRRITRLEYAYTIQDLLSIDETIATDLGRTLPPEADSGGLDTVAAHQNMSPLHVRAYLDAADTALDAALPLGPRPPGTRHTINYATSRYLGGIATAKGLGLGIVKKLDDAFVAFFDFGSTYTFHSDSEGFRVRFPGRYKVAVEASSYQATTPVTLKLYKGRKQGIVASLDELIGSFDLVGNVPRTVEVMPYLRPGDLIGLSVADLDVPPSGTPGTSDPAVGYGGMKDYEGEGIALKTMTIEGPLVETWPPESTRQLLTGVAFDEAGEIRLTKEPYAHVVDIVARFAPRAFRRPLAEGELEAYASLARPLLADGRPFLEAVRVPLRAILSAPPFLYHAGEGKSSLDGFELATRLAYFLWRSLPDEELFDLARQGRLTEPAVIARQVDRLLDSPKRERFIKDFAGQAFRLYELKATSPDAGLYPEFDDRLGQAMERETELFLGELVTRNLGADHLVDADFTFVNRRLAEHYGITGIEGQQMRKVKLAENSPRGGLLTHASILKVTANGTTTSPVPRGNFVLARLLGTPPPPPPPGIAGLEPDTRGTTTIREQLTSHRANPACATCHRKIDPPGFALESFDPIGGFRTHYRASGGEMNFGGFKMPAPYREGPPVDASGVTPDGEAFAGIEDYKRLMLRKDLGQVAHHLVSQLLVYATGAEIEFADRDAVERILSTIRDRGYPIRTMIHEVVRSDLFRSR